MILPTVTDVAKIKIRRRNLEIRLFTLENHTTNNIWIKNTE